MNILVCVKQVPDTTEIKIDPIKNTLVREGVPSILNPFDGYALEAAARIKDAVPTTNIVALSMGPEQAKSTLRECLSIAADNAYLLSDPIFSGSDTFATSYIISEAIKKVETMEGRFDAIFCGKQAIDGDTAQVGPEIAEHLGYPQITCALEAVLDGNLLTVKKETETGTALLRSSLPCVVTFTKPAWDPRYPSIKRKMAAKKIDIPTMTAEDLPAFMPEQSGLKGSPTKVKKTFVPAKKDGGILISEVSAEVAAEKLLALLRNANLLEGGDNGR